jgi:ribosome-binding factor A
MPRDPHRRIRIESELQRAVSELLRREVKDPRVGNVTITAVKMSPDLTQARLFYSLFGEGLDAQSVQTGLDNAARFMRGQVGRRLRLRVAPELTFRPDEVIAEGERMTALIDEAVAADRRAQPEGKSDVQADSLPEERSDDTIP